MSYSMIGVLAIILHLIINREAMGTKKDRGDIPAKKEYRQFLIGVLIFYFIDALWGLFDDMKLIASLYLDTLLFFFTMTISVLLWTRYVVAYLEEKGVFKKALYYAGVSFLFLEIAALIVNIFTPIVFYFDRSGMYHATWGRYITCGIQALLFLITSLYTFSNSHKAAGAKRNRYLSIGIVGVAISIMTVIQLFFPLMPLFTLGYLIGTCLLHSHVVEDEKEEAYRKLKELVERDEEKDKELYYAREKIYTDPMTGAKSKQAYVEEEELIDNKIKEGTLSHVGVAVFDLNDLKRINDTYGHEIGNIHIYMAYTLISEFFNNSSVYRIGGDEFVSILMGEDYRHRESLMSAFDHRINENQKNGQVVVASGMAVYIPGMDDSLSVIFERADKNMYKRKKQLKLSTTR